MASERALKEIVVQAAIGVRSLMFSHFYECTCSFCTFNKAVDALLASRKKPDNSVTRFDQLIKDVKQVKKIKERKGRQG